MPSNGSNKGGRPKIIRTPEQIAEVALRLARGESNVSIARDLDCDDSVVSRFGQAHEETIQELQRACKFVATEKVLQSLADAVGAQMAAAKDSACRHGPQALRSAAEVAGLIGKAPYFHFGDQYTAVNVDASQHLHVEMSEEERVEYAAFKKKHGLA